MLISLRWLSRHVDLDDLSPGQIADDLTLSTAEVEGLERWAPQLSDVLVGHVLERGQHPNADKLSLCQVDIGVEQPLQIVCGAPNVAAGQKVAVARVGTVLPGPDGGLKLKKSKIRGVESQGMICSRRELELGEDHAGIWVLPEELPVGRPVAEALGCEDWILEIDNKSLTHRPDLWGHRGIAKELAAIHSRELEPLDLSLPDAGDGEPVAVTIESAACSRYLAIALDGVRNGPSPSWLEHLLLAVGQRPISLLVDISNFVMLDLGQPNHLFDRRLVCEGITVRDARAGETLTTLDGIERKLATSDMLICSGQRPVALAGVMGGEESMVQDDTSGLLLEVATFDPVRVRRTSSRLALRTDSSARFEKSLDPTLPEKAAAHLVRTLQSIQPEARIAAPVFDAGDWRDPAFSLSLRPERVRALLGAEIGDAEIAGILERLQFSVQRGATFNVGVPSDRATKDIQNEQDLIEEVGRIYRYGNIPEALMSGVVAPAPHDARRELVRRLADRMAGGARFREALTYSFQSDALLSALGADEQPYVTVENPAAEGLARVRRSVAPSLIAGLAQNLRHAECVRLFEIGKGYRPEHGSQRGEPGEVHELAFVLAAPRPGKQARFDAGALFGLRGVLDDLLPGVGLCDPEWSAAASEETEAGKDPKYTGGEPLPAWLHPGRSLRLAVAGTNGPLWVGTLGELEPGVARALEIDADVAVGWISIDACLQALPRGADYRPIPRFPGVKVDVALSLPTAVRAADAEQAIERAGKDLVRSAELFDLYQGESLGAGRKSLAWHVLLQSPDKTLSDKETHKFLGRLERLVADLGGELRRD